VIERMADIRSPEAADWILKERPDVVCHLASIVTPGKRSSREFEYSVDVLGTRNILEACLKAGVRKVIVSSSGAAYGYHPDSPVSLVEQAPLRGNPEFAYSDHKRMVEEMLEEYRARHPELQQLVLRLSTVIGASVKNQITALFEKPFLLGIAGAGTPFSFIWDHDVVEIVVRGCVSEVQGIFNVAGDGTLSLSQIATIQGKAFIPVPAWVMGSALFLLKSVGLTRYGPEQLRFLRYRPVLANQQLKKTFPGLPSKTSAEAFMEYHRAQSTRYNPLP
jgi:UDP-glucose 4-epimerase